MAISISEVRTAAAWVDARQLIGSYIDSLGIDLTFQNITGELAQLETMYGPPQGAFFLAADGTASVGCVGMRRLSPEDAEMKRLYVVPSARGRGVGRLLAEVVIEKARSQGYRRLLLDTLPAMAEARGLYEQLGFSEIAPYRVNPVEGTAFLALALR